MISRFLELIGFFLLCCLVLGLEQVYGLPWLFFILVAFLSDRFPSVWRAGWWLLMALVFAGMYHLALITGLTVVLITSAVFSLTDRVTKMMIIRFFLVGAVGLVTTAVVSAFQMTLATTSSILISMIASYIGFRLILIQKV